MSTPNPRSIATLLAGMGAGGILMYLLDRNQGKRRRHVLRDRTAHALRRQRSVVSQGVRDVAHRAGGAVERLRHPQGDTSDEVLAPRVRSALGRLSSHPSAIEVTVNEGIVTLSGPILASEYKRVVRKIERVAGVHGIEDRLDPHQRAGQIPGLQGAGRVARPVWRRESWPPSMRLLAAAAAIVLTLRSLRRQRAQHAQRAICAAAGTGLLLRAATNLPFRRLLGIGAGPGAISLQKSIYIDAPVDAVYDLWSHFDQFPKFMQHVREVAVSEGNPDVSSWQVEGPAGQRTRWTVAVTRRQPSKLLAWATQPGCSVEHAGAITFQPEGTGTRLHLRLSYSPPAGALGHAVLKLLGSDFKTRLNHDLVRMKSLFEQGSTRAHGHRVRLEDVRAP